MKSLLDIEGLAKRFLLDYLSEPERAQIEDRFLADDDFYQEILVVEDDLIDAYVRDELPAPDRSLFETRYLTSESRRERVEFAQTLFNAVSRKSATVVPADEQKVSVSWWHSLPGNSVARRPALAFSMAAALLVMALGGIWLLVERTRTRPEQARANPPATDSPRESRTPGIAQVEQPPSKPAQEAQNTPANATPTRTAPVIATFTLLPGMVRGQSGAQLILPANTTEVHLHVVMDGEAYKKYRATLSTPEGRKLWSRDVTNKPSMKSSQLTLSIPAALLADGDYVIEVGGTNADGVWQSVADYSFRVVKR